MKNFFKKNWSLIGLIFAFILDNSFDILRDSGLTQPVIDLIRGIGAIVSGYFWTTDYNKKVVEKQELIGTRPKDR